MSNHAHGLDGEGARRLIGQAAGKSSASPAVHVRGPAPSYWRSLEELAGTREFQEALHQEFPAAASLWDDGVSRRSFLKVMAASLALAGLNGCFYKKPQGEIVPATRSPEESIPGRPIYFATAMPFDGYARGVLVASNEGRPTKIEGNPDHPASLGATDVFMQASILDLYDPDRARNVLISGRISRWSEFTQTLRDRLEQLRGSGQGLRLLTGVITSPTLAAQIQEFRTQYPQAVWHQYDPVRSPGVDGRSRAFAEPVNTAYDFSKAGVIVSFDCDFLIREPGSVRYARQFSDGRRIRRQQMKMNRLYVAEGTMTVTGSVADHRLCLRPSQIEPLVRALARQLGVAETSGGGSALSAEQLAWARAASEDLRHPGEEGSATARSLVIAGESQPPAVHALVHLINQKLGNIGQSVYYTDAVEVTGAQSLKQLVSDMAGGAVDTLLIVGGNPAYDAPRDLPFVQALKDLSARMSGGNFAALTAHLATHYDETSYLCQWHLPEAHWLEAWGDVRAYDGTVSLIQPLIAPLYDGRSACEVMEAVLGRFDRPGIEILRDHWRQQIKGDFEPWWVESLQKGFIADTALPPREPPALRDGVSNDRPGNSSSPGSTAPSPNPEPRTLNPCEVSFQPDPCAWAGQFANNAWLQELPKPFTKLTWGNAALISVPMAEKLGTNGRPLRDGDIVRLRWREWELTVPVMLVAGQADELVTLQLGYGRSQGGRLLTYDDGSPRGYNAFAFRPSDSPWGFNEVQIEATGQHRMLVTARNHHAMAAHPDMPGINPKLKPQVIAASGDSREDLTLHNRNLIRTATIQQLRENPECIEDLEVEKKPLLSLYPGWDYQQGLQWGMVIDQTACIGCNACIVACQAENNIPVVGQEEVSRQREMHWIRIDSYFTGSLQSPQVFHQPVTCMHCENAPCEYVCPVGATTHSDEGINEMTYNRCIGTRYCSNNCPYKVRRFNFLLYSDYAEDSRSLQYNPDVTVRSRGVMEKCTYCIQRINRTRIEMEQQTLALKELARRAPSEAERQRLTQEAEQTARQIVRTLQTACQQACPTEAIVFGDIRDPGSAVAQLKHEPTNYVLLKELTTVPRTSYLARFTNPSPGFRIQGSAINGPTTEPRTPNPEPSSGGAA